MPGLIRSQNIIDLTAASSIYSSSFPGSENPLSESGHWLNGGTTGGSWNNVRKTPGLAFAAALVSTVDDCLAVLTTGFGVNQYIEGTVHRAGGYSPPDSHEIELLGRFVITPGVARGCEVNWGHAGNLQIVKWNGPFNDFEVLTTVSAGPPAHGDRLRLALIDSTAYVFKNDVFVTSVVISGLADGQPGIGFFPRAGATLSSLGWSSIIAGSF
jgi:hypothetical protein